MTVKQLGDLIGRSASWVYKLEAGELPGDQLRLLVDISIALRIDLGTFLCAPAPGVPSDDQVRLLHRMAEAFQSDRPQESLAALARSVSTPEAWRGTDWVLAVLPGQGVLIMDRRQALKDGAMLIIGLNLPGGRDATGFEAERARMLAGTLRAAREGRRIGASGVGALADLTSTLRRLDDEIGSEGLLPAVRAHLEMTANLLAGGQAESVQRSLGAIAAQLAQLAGWLSVDSGNLAAADTYYQTALENARDHNDPAIESHTLAMLSMRHNMAGKPSEARAATQVAARCATRAASPTLQAHAAIREALALSNMGEREASHAAVEHARSLVPEEPDEHDPGYVYWIDIRAIEGMAGMAYARIGDTKRCLTALDRSMANPEIAALFPTFVRDRAELLTWKAFILVDAGEIDQAEMVALDAADLLSVASSRRTTQELGVVAARMTQRGGARQSRRIRERLRAVTP